MTAVRPRQIAFLSFPRLTLLDRLGYHDDDVAAQA